MKLSELRQRLDRLNWITNNTDPEVRIDVSGDARPMGDDAAMQGVNGELVIVLIPGEPDDRALRPERTPTMQLKPTFAQLLPLLTTLEWTPGRTMEPRSYLANYKGWTFQLDTIALSAFEPRPDGARRGRGHTWHGPDVREFVYDVCDHLDCTAPDWTALHEAAQLEQRGAECTPLADAETRT